MYKTEEEPPHLPNKEKEEQNNKTLYILKTHIHAWLISAGLPMRTPEHRSRL